MSAARPDTWMPLYVADYLADTGHLSTRQHGAYLLLIMHYWRTGKALPTRVEHLFRICRLTNEEWSEDGEAVMEFFDLTDGGYVHGRVEKELQSAQEFIAKKAVAGKASAQARAQQRGNTPSTPVATPDPTDGQLEPKTTPSPSPVTDAVLSAGANVSREISEAEKNEVRKICEAFNDELKTIFTSRAPINPNGSNGVYALRMVRAGATVDLIRPLIVAALTNKAANGKAPILSLNYFDAPVMDALAALKSDLPKGNPNAQQRRDVDPKQQRADAGAAILRGLARSVGAGMVAGVRPEPVPDGAGTDSTADTGSLGAGAETLPVSEYRVLCLADGTADELRDDVRAGENGCGERDGDLSRDAGGLAGGSAGAGDLGDDTGSQVPEHAEAGGHPVEGGGSVPGPLQTAAQAGNGPARHRAITDEELVETCPAFLRRRA